MRQFLKYIFVSSIALMVDYASYLLVAQYTILSIPEAAVLGYIAGMLVAYSLMVTKVFDDRWLKNNQKKEFALFLISGLLGIVLTYWTVLVVTMLFNGGVFMSKGSAVIISFCGVFLFRKYYVFKSCNSE